MQTVEDLKTELRGKGYNVEVRPDGATTVVEARKSGKSTETHGLLSVQWDEQITVTGRYFASDGAYNLVDSKAKVQRKAPVIGKWEEVPAGVVSTPSLPRKLAAK